MNATLGFHTPTVNANTTLLINGVGNANRLHVAYDNGGDYWVVYNVDRPSEILHNADSITDCILWAVAYSNFAHLGRNVVHEMSDELQMIAQS